MPSGPFLLILAMVVACVVGAIVLVRRRRQGRWVDPILLFGEADVFPGPRARRWAYGVLNEAGVDSDSDPRYAAEVLCDAEPRLRPDDARRLVAIMNG